jgi:penicillin-binding protein 1A
MAEFDSAFVGFVSGFALLVTTIVIPPSRRLILGFAVIALATGLCIGGIISSLETLGAEIYQLCRSHVASMVGFGAGAVCGAASGILAGRRLTGTVAGLAVGLPAERRLQIRRGHAARAFEIAVFVIGALTGAGYAITHHLPSGEFLRVQVSKPQVRIDTVKLAKNHQEEFATDVICQCFIALASSDIPQYVKSALISAEDRRFYAHHGFDARGALRAMLATLGGSPQGGSTITQQLAKNTVVGRTRHMPEVILRKIREIVVAWRIEEAMSKDDILASFLNTADFGSTHGWTAFGLEQAARKYYRKHAHDLNLYEAAEIVGMLKGTSKYNPTLHPELARQRANVIIASMVADKLINSDEGEQALRTGRQPGNLEPLRVRAGYYTAWLFRELVSIAASRKVSGEARFVVGLDPLVQIRAEQVIAAGLNEVAGKSAREAALLAMAPDGRVLAMVGGRDFARSQYNRAVQALRQPGSTSKLFAFAAGIEAGLTPDSSVVDLPLDPRTSWPKNFDEEYHAQTTVRYAFENSLNAAAVRIAKGLGTRRVADMALRLGVPGFDGDLSLTLGSREVSLLRMTAAYGVFANAGRPIVPFGTIQATDGRGYVVYQLAERTHSAAVEPRVVDSMRDMLRATVMNGTARNSLLNNGDWAGGKTGTSQGYRDAWFIGFTETLVTGIWFGNDHRQRMWGITGADIPAITWRRFNEDVHRELRDSDMAMVAANNNPPSKRLPMRLAEASTLDAVIGSAGIARADALPNVVAYRGAERPGTIVINTYERFLYLVQGEGQAIRYPIGVGRPGYTWAGTANISAKREWPDWRPTRRMLERRPDLPRVIHGGPVSPLGARALYIGSTVYRIHGSNEPETIGQPSTWGCFRMRNQDVIDLYDRVELGAKLIVN